MKRSDFTHGELVIVRRPHQRPCTVTMFDSLDDAFDAYSDGVMYCHFANLKEMLSSFDEESDADIIESLTDKVHAEGIKDNEPFVEFTIEGNEATFDKESEFSKLSAVCECASDDMSGAEVFETEKGETYGQFEKRIVDWYSKVCPHNAPSKSQIEYAFMLDD